MFRIDHPSAAVALPVPGAAGTPGYFTEGDPAGSTPATTVTADWANAVQEEIAHVIEGAAIELDKTDNGQLLVAINALIAGVGTGALLKANNLSDVTNVATARANLGLGGLAVKSAAAISDVTGLQGALDAKAALAGAGFTGVVSVTTNGSTNSIIITDAGQSGANLKLAGSGASTPNKYLRARAGVLEFVNSAYTAVIGSVDDAGNMKMASYDTNSSLRYKRVLEVLDSHRALTMLRKIGIVLYELKADASRAAGVVAEELAGTELDFAVRRDAQGRPDAVNYQSLFAVAACAVQGLSRRVEALEQRAA